MALHAAFRRDNRPGPDYFPTAPPITEAVLPFLGGGLAAMTCLEPAAGGGHMVDVLARHFRRVVGSDILDPAGRGWGGQDFLHARPPKKKYDWLVTNPPFRLAERFILRAGMFAHNYAFLGKLSLLEGQSRYRNIFRRNPPSVVAVFVKRQNFYIDRLPTDEDVGSPICYAWFVWRRDDKGCRIEWIYDSGPEPECLPLGGGEWP